MYSPHTPRRWRRDLELLCHELYDLRLTQYDDRGGRATFYTTGMEHSPTSATGTAWERTPWRATQRAAWEALKKTDC